MANIYYNEKTGLPEFRVGFFGFCFTVVVLLMWISWVFVKATLFIVKAPVSSGGIDNKTIIKK